MAKLPTYEIRWRLYGDGKPIGKEQTESIPIHVEVVRLLSPYEVGAEMKIDDGLVLPVRLDKN